MKSKKQLRLFQISVGALFEADKCDTHVGHSRQSMHPIPDFLIVLLGFGIKHYRALCVAYFADFERRVMAQLFYRRPELLDRARKRYHNTADRHSLYLSELSNLGWPLLNASVCFPSTDQQSIEIGFS